jgi:hypothetical protein
MRRAIWSGDAGPIQHEGHARFMKRNVHQNLIKRAIQKG